MKNDIRENRTHPSRLNGLSAVCAALGVSTKTLAEMAEVRYQTAYRLLNAQAGTSLQVLEKLAEGLGVSTDELLRGCEPAKLAELKAARLQRQADTAAQEAADLRSGKSPAKKLPSAPAPRRARKAAAL